MNNGSGERTAKKEMAINDFSLLSEFGIIGHYIECELTHIFLFERKTSLFHHYFAVCSYEEFKEPDISIRDNKISEKLVEVNENFSLGIIQKRISFDESNYIFTQLCSGSFSLGTTTVLMSKNLQLLPKAHIPAYWDGIGVTLQNVLKPNFFGDTYIIEFLSLENPFLNTLTALDFDKVNINISKLIKLDLSSVNDRIGSFIFQFPIIR